MRLAEHSVRKKEMLRKWLEGQVGVRLQALNAMLRFFDTCGGLARGLCAFLDWQSFPWGGIHAISLSPLNPRRTS
jgi:hypothetical protein